MSIEAITYAKTLRVADPTLRLLLWAIGENTFNDTCRCKVGNTVLARDVGVNERTIRRRLDELERGGLIVRHPRHGRAGRRADALETVGFAAWLQSACGIQPDKLSGGLSGDDDAPDTDIDGTTSVSGPPDNLATGQVAQWAAGVRLPTGQQVSGGNKESRTRSSRTLSPPTPTQQPVASQGGEGERELDREDEDQAPQPKHHPIVEELLGEGQPEHVAVGLIGWLLRDLQPWKHVADPLATARQLCADLAATRLAIVETARSELRKGARYRLPVPADILAAVEAAERSHDAAAAQRRQAEERAASRAAADPALGERTKRLATAIEARLGADVFQSWFATLAVEAVDGGRITVSLGSRFVREWVASNHEAALLDACRVAFGDARRVDIVAPPAASEAA